MSAELGSPDAPAGRGGVVDWDVAVRAAARFSNPGPQVELDTAREAVASLRTLAVEARSHVADLTRLHADAVDAPVAVVDRAAWVEANADGFRTVMDPLVDRLRVARDAREGTDGSAARGLVDAVGSRVTGLQVGALLGYLSSRVLGQYELFTPPGATPRLLLVAPNLVAAEQAMGVDPHDFRLWVCIHEETHRVQFTAVPWLGDHLRSEVERLVEATDVDPAALSERLGPLVDAVRSAVRGSDGPAMSDVVTTPEQRVVLDRVTAVMTLLEGHADYVMDAVGPAAVPTVGHIRTQFETRRSSGRRVEQILRRLLGVDAKLAQYRNGSAFVRTVVDQVGMDGFNQVWTSPNTLPRPEEIADPASWVARVHG
jgi:coenzyme F420 biosynthesis associated uncharacterized protein